MSAFFDFLEWLDRPGQAVRNMLSGRPDGAGRHVVDFLSDIPDAILPGDVIPNLTTEEDDISGSELVGMQDAHWAPKLAADIGVGIATDPLSFLGVGPALRAGKAVKDYNKARTFAATGEFNAVKGGKAMPDAPEMAAQYTGPKVTDEELASLRSQADAARQTPIFEFGIGKNAAQVGPTYQQAADAIGSVTGALPDFITKPAAKYGKAAGHTARSMFGWLNTGKHLDDTIAAAEGLGSRARELGDHQINDIFDDISQAEDRAISSVFDNVYQGDEGWEKLAEFPTDDRVRMAAERFGVDETRLRDAVDRISDLNAVWWRDLQDISAVPLEKGRPSYLHRVWNDLHPSDYDDLDISPEILETTPGSVGAQKQRKFETDDELLDALNKDPALTDAYEGSARKRMLARSAQQGTATRRAGIYRDFLGEGVSTIDDESRMAMGGILRHLKTVDPDMYTALRGAVKGQDQDGWFTKLISLNNKIFKPAATAGILVPRFAFNVRNKLSSIWQAASVEGASAGQAAMSVPGDLAGAMADGLRSVGIGTGRKGGLAKELETLDEAFEQSGGSLQDMLGRLESEPMLKEAVERGVIDGYVSSEGLASSIFGLSGKKGQPSWNNVLSYPSEITQGLETRMRLGAFMDLRRKGTEADEAARIVRDTFLNYSNLRGSGTYRTLRQFLPFLAFTAQSIPQQAKFIGRAPAAGVGIAQVVGSDDEPVRPYIANQPHFSLGEGADGNNVYATSLGLPIEALDSIPLAGNPFELGSEFERTIIGSSNPLIKSGYSFVTGKDPFFGTTYGSYDRTPVALQALGVPENSEVGRLYHLAKGTGIIQPLDSLMQPVERLADDRMTGLQKGLNLFTGLRLASNDPDRATVEIIQDQLRRDPRADSFTSYYGGSDEIDELIAEMTAARKRLKAKREAQITE